jgi:hypothetical protein
MKLSLWEFPILRECDRDFGVLRLRSQFNFLKLRSQFGFFWICDHVNL